MHHAVPGAHHWLFQISVEGASAMRTGLYELRSPDPQRKQGSRPMRVTIPRARDGERLAGGTRRGGRPSFHAGVAITAPSSGALLTGLGVRGFTPLRSV